MNRHSEAVELGFPRAYAGALHDRSDEALVLGFGVEAARRRQFLTGGGFDHGVCLWGCADSIAVRPLPFASLKVTGQTPGP